MFAWFTGSKIKKLQSDLVKQEETITHYVESFSVNGGRIPEYCTILGGDCTSTGVLLWEKDLENKYTYANMRHCNDFYQISHADVSDLYGRTDEELINEFKHRMSTDNTFGNMCCNSDNHTLKEQKLCRFWEFGYVNAQIVILDVRKQPLFDTENNLKGTRGWATNLSNRECEMKTLIEIYLQNGTATRLDDGSLKSSASYLITKTDNVFNWKFPR